MEKTKQSKLLKKICKKEGRMDEYNSYIRAKEALESDVNRYTRYLNDAIQKFENVKNKFPKDSQEYLEAQEQVHRWEYTLEERKLALKFVRPNTSLDIEYRNNQLTTFVKQLQEIMPQNLELRFHGTPIYYAEQIIKSGEISSSADRYDGYIRSTDRKGEISASSIATLGRTINNFSDMTAYNRDMPAGCIFALLPKEEDATCGIDLMHTVDFRKNPEQFFGVFTTPENVEQVKEWMNESGFDTNIVHTFEGFLKTVKEKSSKENNTSLSNENHDSYVFNENDAKEIAVERRVGSLITLKEKISHVIEEIKNKFKEHSSKENGGSSNDQSTRD